jgi:hypothetical protein
MLVEMFLAVKVAGRHKGKLDLNLGVYYMASSSIVVFVLVVVV